MCWAHCLLLCINLYHVHPWCGPIKHEWHRRPQKFDPIPIWRTQAALLWIDTHPNSPLWQSWFQMWRVQLSSQENLLWPLLLFQTQLHSAMVGSISKQRSGTWIDIPIHAIFGLFWFSLDDNQRICDKTSDYEAYLSITKNIDKDPYKSEVDQFGCLMKNCQQNFWTWSLFDLQSDPVQGYRPDYSYGDGPPDGKNFGQEKEMTVYFQQFQDVVN